MIDLTSLKTNAERLEYCYEFVLDDFCSVPDADLLASKSEDRALDARHRGNQFYVVHKNYLAALECYNESLCFAPAGSESLGMAYANRSAIYFEAGFFESCLINIELALDHDYPARLTPKLLERREKCLTDMNNQPDAATTYQPTADFELSYPADPRAPFIIDGIKVETNLKYGRHIVTTKNLKPGDVICMEEIFSKAIRKEVVYSHCFNCLDHHFLDLKPCPRTTTVMFCSEKCATEAWNRYYKLIYPVIDAVMEFHGNYANRILQLSLRALTMFDELADLQDLIDSIEVDKEHGLTIDYSEGADEKTLFRAAYTLETNEKIMSSNGMFEVALDCANIWTIVCKSMPLMELLKGKKETNLFWELLMHLRMIMTTNSYNMVMAKSKNYTIDELVYEDIGSSTVLLSSLFSHSCWPNVIYKSTLKHFIIVAARPITAGEQLFIGYW